MVGDVGDSTPFGSVRRALWLVLGLIAAGVGAVGVIVPGLPTTGFFILAAACFSKSSPRLEAWVLNLRGIGPLVQDYRSGLGMPRRAKRFAIAMMLTVGTLSAVLAFDALVWRLVIIGAVLIGSAYVQFVVPTRERVLAARSAEPSG